MVINKKINSFALISVYNKNNLSFLCNFLEKNQIGIISTGSTSKKIKSLGYECLNISKLTNFKEVLNGRVKTLHPKIYISILHDRDNNDHKKTFSKSNFPKIDYIIVNLYPFMEFQKKDPEETIEMIDIGGPTLLRAAAKNYKHLTTISCPEDYKKLKENIKKNSGTTNLSFRKKMAEKTFKLTHEYDLGIYNWFSKKQTTENIKLRYGENPNQQASLNTITGKSYVDHQIHGKAISYNNILDIDSGLDFLSEFKEPTTVIIKHNNACGIASSKTIKSAFIKALNSDKKSSFGGVVLINKKLNENLAKILVKNFFEILVAPGFTKSALEILNKRKKLIIINSSNIPKVNHQMIKTVRMGTLAQMYNSLKITKKIFKAVSKNKKISKKEYEDILFAFKVVKHIKSNGIVLVKNKQTLGVGAGQMNRYDATKFAIMKYKENFNKKNIVCASDAFFPFVDSLRLLLKNNCTCIVQPNGSVNDNKVIDFVNKNKLKLIFSSQRVFKH